MGLLELGMPNPRVTVPGRSQQRLQGMQEVGPACVRQRASQRATQFGSPINPDDVEIG